MPVRLILTPLFAAVFAGAAATADIDGRDELADLAALAGDWESVDAETPHGFTVSQSARGSVVVERWRLGGGRDALTVYHRDDEGVVATHYCPRGNQPRLKARSRSRPDELAFDFVDGDNVDVAGAYHQHHFRIRILGPDAIQRCEIYVENGVAVSAAEIEPCAAWTTYRRQP